MTKTEMFVSETNETKVLCIENQYSWLLLHYLKGVCQRSLPMRFSYVIKKVVNATV